MSLYKTCTNCTDGKVFVCEDCNEDECNCIDTEMIEKDCKCCDGSGRELKHIDTLYDY